MSRLFYISHPEVVVDPTRTVTDWCLSETGIRRTFELAQAKWLANTERIYCSSETKAIETATILSQSLRPSFEVRPNLGENDRSSTGFVPPDQFEKLANAFFDSPNQSVEGWERAIDAQHRIVAATADFLEIDDGHDTVVVGHGGVGTLLYCHLAGVPISRSNDQPGQGHYLTIARSASLRTHLDQSSSAVQPQPDAPDPGKVQVLHPWRRFEHDPSLNL